MNTCTVVIPELSESISEVSVQTILKKSGTFVRKSEELIEIESSKFTSVIYAPQSGILNLSIKEGDILSTGAKIGYIDVQLESTLREIPSSKLPEQSKDMAPITSALSQRLHGMRSQAACVTTFNEVDMEALLQLKEEQQEKFQAEHGCKWSIVPFFMQACIQGFSQFPTLNAALQGQKIITKSYANIAIATAGDFGLVLPVIHNCEQLNFVALQKKYAQMIQKARQAKVTPSDLQGSTFTITNGGIYGSLNSTPLLTPPQSAILGMHAIHKKPVVIGDSIAIRRVMNIALTYDHRIVQGRDAISFLQSIKQFLEKDLLKCEL